MSGTTKRARGDKDVIVLKEKVIGRPKKPLSESNPKASVLFSKVSGIVKALTSVSETGLESSKIIKSIKGEIAQSDKKTANELHHYIVNQRNDRDEKLELMKKKLSDMKKEAKFTASQKVFSAAMKQFCKEQCSQMRKFLVCCLQELEFISLTSEFVSSHLEVERLYCMAMDSRNDFSTSVLHSGATGDTQDIDDDEDYDGEYDIDDAAKDDGYKSDKTTDGYN